MARLTRQSARLNPVPSPATTTTNSSANPSPAFSIIESSVGHDTPPTSDDELPLAVTREASKRQSVLEEEDSAAEDAKPAPKRRASTKQVYVEIETTRRGKGKAQVSLVVPCTCLSQRLSNASRFKPLP